MKFSWPFTFLAISWIIFLALNSIPHAKENQSAEIPPGPERFECGRYDLKGFLERDSLGFSYLKIYPKTTRQFQILITGLKIDDLIANLGKNIKLNAFIYKNGTGSEVQAKILNLPKRIALTSTLTSPVQLVKREKCNLSYSDKNLR